MITRPVVPTLAAAPTKNQRLGQFCAASSERRDNSGRRPPASSRSPSPASPSGDVVTSTRIDRLARSTFDLFAIVKQIVDTVAQFRSLAEPWADTATSTGRLRIADLGGLADVERDLIRTRTAEGRSRAKARGQHMGRPPKLTPQQQREARRRRDEGATL